MASRVWLLVEWVEESNVLPSYGVVDVDILAYDETDLQPGKLIFIRIRYENPRAAKILQISECKTYVKNQRKILRRQDQLVNKVLRLCMLTINEIKSENSFNVHQQSSSHSPLPRVGVAQNGHSDNDSDNDNDSDSGNNFKVKRRKTRNFSNSTPKYTNIRSIISRTSLPSTSAQENIRLCFDQETQTEETFLPPPVSEIEEFIALLKNHYKRFQYANVNSMSSTSMSESEHNGEVPLGYGNAQVPANHMGSRSCTCATWQSLQAVFSRRVLAAHSLLDRQSPAFCVFKPKKILDSLFVDDIIVKTISTKCSVPKNLVKDVNTITRTEEENLHRNWHRFRQARQCRHQVTELEDSSDESTLL